MEPAKTHTEKELLLLVSNGDEAAFAELFHRYRNKIYVIAFKLTESVQASEEIVQDVFMKVWKKKETLTTIEDFNSWLFIVARNACFLFLRDTAKKILHPVEISPELVGLTDETDASLMEKELKGALRQAVDKLPPQQKQVYLLSKEEGWKQDEIAKHLNISPETAKKHLQYAMRSIRAYVTANLDLGLVLLFLWKNS